MKDKIDVLEFDNKSWVNKTDYDELETSFHSLRVFYYLSVLGVMALGTFVMVLIFG